jgi:hypothetical protein
MTTTTHPNTLDPRRQRPIIIHWDGLIGKLTIDGEIWGAVEWSEKRQAFCVEDAEGRCLSHHSHIHGADTDKAGAVVAWRGDDPRWSNANAGGSEAGPQGTPQA